MAAASCGTSSHDPRLTAIEPALVTSLAATPGVVRGAELDALVKLDLGGTGSAEIDRRWRVRIGEVDAVDTVWIDRERIDIVVPRGLTVGTHDVVAITPAGAELVLRDALTVTGEPVGLALSIEDAPGGSGNPVTGTLAAGDQVTAHAVVRDRDRAFVADVAVEWGMTAMIGSVGSAAPSTAFTAKHVGTGALTAKHVAAALDAQSGELVVIAGPATHIVIADAAGTAGDIIGDRSGLTTDSDGGLLAYAVGRDAFENPTGDVTVTWSLTGVTGAVPANDASSAAVDFATPGIGVLHATHATLGAATTGSLDVSAGRAATLAITTNTLTLTADDAPYTFAATAIDGDGNPTTNLGTLTWAIASGPITSIDAATGVLDPIVAGVGTIGVTSSWGPMAQSGSITITGGAPTSVVVSPPTLTLSADATPAPFSAAITDADGNTTSPGSLTWTIDSGPITAIGSASGVLDPQAAGTGMIRATAGNGTSGTAMVTITPGKAATLAVAPDTLITSQGAATVPFTVTAVDADANPTTDLGTITWSIGSGPISAIDSSTGVLTPTAAGTGSIIATSSYGASDTTGAIQIRSAAALTASMTVNAQVSVDQTFSVAMTVTNTGQVDAQNITPCTLTFGGTATASIATTPQNVATLAAGASTIMTWTVTATAAGSLSLTTCANGSDAVTGTLLTAPASGATTVLRAPALTATLSIPELVGRATAFTVRMQITNTGEIAANNVTPSVLTKTGSGTITLLASPAAATIAPSATATFLWSYQANTVGTVQLTGGATGTNAVSNASASAPAVDSNIGDIIESYVAIADPFGEGSPFAFVAGYRGHVYIGTNSAGTVAARMLPDATGASTLTFSFARDTTGNTHANTSTPYTSIGAQGCTANTSACGPDNENLRGLFTSATIAGTEWLITSGAKSNAGASYLYMTTATTSPLSFRYVDLSSIVSGSTMYGVTAAGTVGNRLYVGTGGFDSGRSKLIAIGTQPGTPGLDAGGGDAVDMTLENLSGWQSGTNPGNLDAIASVGSLAYVANKNLWVRSDVASPVPMPDTCLLCCVLGCTIHWVDITPSAAAYGAKTSRATTKRGQLEPADRAVPAIVPFGGRVFVARNTTAGPQLWGCTPTNSRCDSGDWALVAANSTGDTQLTQFNNPALTSITMLVATSAYLYVGFDSAAGLQIFRTANPAAQARSAFEGTNGCSAASHPATCAGYGGAGVGDATNTRIFDAKALTFGTSSSVWMTVGNGTNPVSVVWLP